MGNAVNASYPCCHSRNRSVFCSSPFAKTCPFHAGQNERFHPAKPSFYPPAVTAGITHYTLQAKPCAKGASPLETPCFVGKSVRPTRLRLHPIPPKHKQAAWASPSSVLIYAACLPIWALTVSPILTVLIYYFHMKGPIRVSRSFSTRIIVTVKPPGV